MRGVKVICTLVCLLMLAGCGNKENPGGSGSGFNLPNIKTEAETETETEEVTTEAVSTTEEVTEAATEEAVAAAFSEEDNYFSPEKALVISQKDMSGQASPVQSQPKPTRPKPSIPQQRKNNLNTPNIPPSNKQKQIKNPFIHGRLYVSFCLILAFLGLFLSPVVYLLAIFGFVLFQ